MTVNLVEQIGAQTYLMGTLAGHKMRAVLQRRDEIRAGDKLPIAFPSERLHLFDSISGASLRMAQTGGKIGVMENA